MSEEQQAGNGITRAELRRRGAEVLARLGHGTTPARARPLYLASVEGMSQYTGEALFGAVWSRPGLSLRHRLLVTVSVLACLQRLPQLRTYLNSALNVDLDPREVREALIQCSVFAGFPTTVNTLELFREVLEGRGLTLDREEVAVVELDELDARGGRLQEELFGAVVADPLPGAAGDARRALAEIERRFVFGELFLRPQLDGPSRAVCALASVIALQRPDEQRAWAGACGRTGVEPAAIAEVVLQCAYYAGFPAAWSALAVVEEVLGRP
jgi:4-carboxymuconolactone decarboxylase